VLFEAMYRRFGEIRPFVSTVILEDDVETTRISLRNDLPDDDDSLFVRMGRNNLHDIAADSLRHYPDYRGLLSDRGRFTFSVFCMDKLPVTDVQAAMRQGDYLFLQYGEVKDITDVIATSAIGKTTTSKMAKIQPWHYELSPSIQDQLIPADDLTENLSPASRKAIRAELIGEFAKITSLLRKTV